MVLPAMREENLAKIEEENDKKFVVLPCQVGERRKVWKELLKKVWISQRTLFKKAETRCSIDRKTGSINRTRQRLTEFLKQDFNWSKIRLDQSKFWKKQLLREKTWFFENLPQSIEYHKNKNKKMHEYEMKCSPKTQVLNQIFQKFRFQIISPIFKATKTVLHKSQGIFQTWLVKP